MSEKYSQESIIIVNFVLGHGIMVWITLNGILVNATYPTKFIMKIGILIIEKKVYNFNSTVPMQTKTTCIGWEVVSEHFYYKESVLNHVDSLWNEYFPPSSTHHILGVHMRGTDKGAHRSHIFQKGKNKTFERIVFFELGDRGALSIFFLFLLRSKKKSGT